MRKEGGPAIDRIHGDASEEKKRRTEEKLARRHADQEEAFRVKGLERVNKLMGRDILKHEREKTPEERQAVALSNAVTDRIRERYGLEPHPIPEENIHFTKIPAWWMEHVASFQPLKQSIDVTPMPDNLLYKTRIMVHEMIHMKSYNAAIVKEGGDEDEDPDMYRVGILTKNLKSGGYMLRAMNEAITERLTRRAMREIEDDPLFAEERAETKRLAEEHPDKVSDDAVVAWEEKGIFGKKVRQDADIYDAVLLAFDQLVNKMHDRLSHEFSSREEVFDLFGKAAMTGRMLVLGRAMKKAFGEDALRKIAEAGDDAKKLQKAIDLL